MPNTEEGDTSNDEEDSRQPNSIHWLDLEVYCPTCQQTWQLKIPVNYRQRVLKTDYYYACKQGLPEHEGCRGPNAWLQIIQDTTNKSYETNWLKPGIHYPTNLHQLQNLKPEEHQNLPVELTCPSCHKTEKFYIKVRPKRSKHSHVFLLICQIQGLPRHTDSEGSECQGITSKLVLSVHKKEKCTNSFIEIFWWGTFYEKNT